MQRDEKLKVYDNALAETIIGLYKSEVIRQRGPWRNIEAVELATLEWVDWFTNRRLFQPIGDVPPAEKEDEYYRNVESAMVAWLTTRSLRNTRGGSRLLYRSSCSAHESSFALKGALLFRVLDIPDTRATRDIDFPAFLDNSPANIAAVFREVCD